MTLRQRERRLTQEIVPCVYAISLGFVNAFLIDTGKLTLIDTGIPSSAERILHAVEELGRTPADITNIVVTHCHADHSGSLAALKQASGASVWMHPADAVLVRQGIAARPMQPAPGLLPKLAISMMMRSGPASVTPTEIEHEINDGDVLAFAGGTIVLHTPGHSAGHVCLLWPHSGGVLFVADAAGHMRRLGLSIIYEDLALGQRSLSRLAALNFNTACFGHGKPIVGNADAQFRRVWPPA
ncbi:MAG: MBL fold metallo-hydrolase [Chloroflexaceae bacterium]|jgi:glyoxylase-like metal-dependent hydrolase (beta-lactamase superfamily II)|nr:MBL fold metallo-hydrolase [Chloroflexaceae bacterium]